MPCTALRLSVVSVVGSREPSLVKAKTRLAGALCPLLLLAVTSCLQEPPPLFTISGQLSGLVSSGIMVSVTGPDTAATITDASGNYIVNVFSAGTYTVKPKLDGYVFNPASQKVTVNDGNVVGRDFTVLTYGGYPEHTDYALAPSSSPWAIATGDFDGDGKRDIVTASRSKNAVSVLRGKGDGTFEAAVNTAVGLAPCAVAVKDFNGDGKDDLVVVNCGTTTASVLRGKGDGTFEAATEVAIGNQSCAADGALCGVVVGDFNKDGRYDFATTNNNAGTVNVLLGNGDATFQAAVTYKVGTSPSSIVAADFNRDGILDLAVANNGGTSAIVSVLMGNGDGTFTATQDAVVGTFPGSVAVGDFDGDGKPDLVTSNYKSDNAVNVLIGNGDGTFQPYARYVTGQSPYAVAVGDFNEDGKDDVITADSYGDPGITPGDVSILMGVGNGSLAAYVNYVTGARPVAVVVDDFDGNRRPDIATTALDISSVSVLLVH